MVLVVFMLLVVLQYMSQTFLKVTLYSYVEKILYSIRGLLVIMQARLQPKAPTFLGAHLEQKII